MRRTITTVSAKRQAWAWRAGAVILALGSGALWAFDARLVSADVELPAPAPGAEASGSVPPQEAGSAALLDRETLADAAHRLDWAMNRPPKPDAPDPGAGQPAATPGSFANWRYLGAILSPGRRSAIVNADGRQRVIHEGQTLNGVRLAEVKPDAIILDDGSGLRELKKEAKLGPGVAWVTPPPNVAPRPGIAGNPLSGYTPEEQAALRERGITPENAQAMRERLDKLRNRARGTPVQITDPSGGTTTIRGPSRARPTRDASGGSDDASDAPESRH